MSLADSEAKVAVVLGSDRAAVDGHRGVIARHARPPRVYPRRAVGLAVLESRQLVEHEPAYSADSRAHLSSSCATLLRSCAVAPISVDTVLRSSSVLGRTHSLHSATVLNAP